MKTNWLPCKWSIEGAMDRLREVFIERVATLSGADRYAIRRNGSVLNKEGDWEYEPQPSSRDEDFFKRCRFSTFEEAEVFYARWLNHGPDKINGG